jgi:hypothetical protein
MVQYGLAVLTNDILPGGEDRLCPMPLRVLSTARRSPNCLVVWGWAGFEKLLLVLESASVRRFDLIVRFSQPQFGEGANE